MVFFAPFLGAAAILSTLAYGAPAPDSAINEPGVRAPNGTPVTDSVKLAYATGYSAGSSSSAMGSSYTSSSSPSYGSSYGSGSSGSYGSSGSSGSYGKGSSDSSSSKMMMSTSTMDSMSTSTMDSMSTSTMDAMSTSTTSAMSSSSTAYGSGSTNWGGSGYDSCVQQCVASFASPAATYTATSSASMSESTSSGTTHMVIVAPEQGVLRYVPFAVNASVGDTIKFVWMASPHTVTKSSALTPCNKTSDAPFASGIQNKSFVFEQVVNTTDTTFYYCGVPTHCQKGMFGIINPPTDTSSNMTVDAMMSSMAASSADISAAMTATVKATEGSTVAQAWGGSMSMSGIPSYMYQPMLENVLYFRQFLAANPDVASDDGTVNLSNAGTNPLLFPQDISAALASTSSTAPAATVSSPAAAAASPSSSVAASGSLSNGGSVTTPGLFITLAAVIATFLAL